MHGSRHCPDCGELLPPDGHERCIWCRPILSSQAQAVGAEKRREREQIENADRQIEHLEALIRKINRRLKL
jgi:hypothetical protein